MRPHYYCARTVALAALLVSATTLRADDAAPSPSRFSRLFRSGSAAPATANRPTTPDLLGPPGDVGAPAASAPKPNASSPSNANGPRLIPQPRVNRPATESDPILTRVMIGRSDNGSQFGMFLQVFADGTVLDGEGTHHVGREVLRPLIEAIQSTDAYAPEGPLRRPADGLHRAGPRRRLRPLARQAPRQFLLVFRQPAGLRPRHQDPASRHRRLPGEARRQRLSPFDRRPTPPRPAIDAAGGETLSLTPAP